MSTDWDSTLEVLDEIDSELGTLGVKEYHLEGVFHRVKYHQNLSQEAADSSCYGCSTDHFGLYHIHAMLWFKVFELNEVPMTPASKPRAESYTQDPSMHQERRAGSIHFLLAINSILVI